MFNSHQNRLFGDKVVDLGNVGIMGVFGVLARGRRLIFATVSIALTGAVFYAFLTPKQYVATCTFVSSTQISGDSGTAALGALSSAASRFGVDLRGNSGDLSPLFPWMLESREIGRRVLNSSFRDSKGRPRILLDVLQPSEPDSLRRLDKGLAKLNRDVLNYAFDRKSGVTRITASLADPNLAAEVANRFVISLDEYNQAVTIANAGSFVTFLEGRLSDIQMQIGKDEQELRAFREQNRGFAQSPSLSLEEARLSRYLELNQQLYLNLRSQFELVRMEEFKHVPRLTVLDPAHPPYKPASPKILAVVMLSLFLGIAVGVLVVIAANQLRWLAAASESTSAGTLTAGDTSSGSPNEKSALR